MPTWHNLEKKGTLSEQVACCYIALNMKKAFLKEIKDLTQEKAENMWSSNDLEKKSLKIFFQFQINKLKEKKNTPLD